MREEQSKFETLKANLKRLMKKKWALPAVYLSLAALVITAFIWMAGDGDQLTEEDPQESEFDIEGPIDGVDDPDADDAEQDALTAAVQDEVFKMPVLDEHSIDIVGTFFDYEASEDEQKDSLVRYNNYYYQNQGIDLSSEDNESFDVVSAMSGNVVKAEEDDLFGKVVEIQHDDEVKTVYQSLADLQVEKGDTVEQGDMIASAGENLFNSDAGVHAHFEIRRNGVAVDPYEYFDEPLAALPEVEEESSLLEQDLPSLPEEETDMPEENFDEELDELHDRLDEPNGEEEDDELEGEESDDDEEEEDGEESDE
ncbi:M23 family metallopeptidase [Texcoconibacillus texcoconensis]|uniref:Stage II sporulation protein Q n=1 Tax=Texcoconibacillus texcoconensis TaxID=1095777 RepID=A0A840QSX1_9BACI|nr:M23 family metallopeptidase [Texcoconibacillus texcoconensis]MBB5174622.1 stage II sporulation protein Q [Texcoconibacillus texcoconensis]